MRRVRYNDYICNSNQRTGMVRRFETYKNIPIGLIIKKDLRARRMSQKTLAQIVGMSYKSLNNAVNGHRDFTREEGERIDKFFDYERDFIINIQQFRKQNSVSAQISISPRSVTVPQIRSCVFWDIDISSIDWIRHHKFIKERVSVYGSPKEKQAVTDFYKMVL